MDSSRHPLPEEKPARPDAKRVMHIMLAVVAAMALVVVVFVAISMFYGKQARDIGQSEDRTPRQIVIGNDVVNVPGNVIRFAEQRNAISLKRLDLYFHWPSFEGFSKKRAEAFFGSNEAGQDLIFATLEKRAITLDMSARLKPVYARLLEGAQQPSAPGLVFQFLRPEAGFSGEELHYENHGERPYVVRCQGYESKKLNITCMRDIHVGEGLSLTYRFSRKHLDQWRQIETAMGNIISSYLEVR